MTLLLANLIFWWLPPNSVDFYRGAFHHPVWFVCFVGVFSVTPSRLICSASLGSLHHWRAWIPLPIFSASSGVLACCALVGTCSSGRWSSLREFHGVLNRLISSILIQTGCFHHPIFRTAYLEPDWTSPGAHWTLQSWLSRCMDFFW